MTNKELKSYMKKNKVRQYEVAEYMGLSESKLSTLFRKQIDQETQTAILVMTGCVMASNIPVHRQYALRHSSLAVPCFLTGR